MKKIVLIAIFSVWGYNGIAQDTTAARKQYLGILTLTEKFRDEKNWTAGDEAVVGEHFQRLIRFKNEGIVILAGRTNYETSNPDMMGLVIFYAKDDDSAKQFMYEDPAVQKMIMTVRVHPYGIAVSNCK